MLLPCLPQALNASVFLSTFYTRVAAEQPSSSSSSSSLKQLLLVHDMLPELLGWDLKDHQ